jgi:hypothetical protein
VAKRKDTSALKLVTAEAQDAGRRFRELFDKTNGKGAKPADVEALRELLADNAGEMFWRRVTGPMQAAEGVALDNFAGLTPGAREAWRARLDAVRRDLKGEGASTTESLLAHHAALCWLRLAEAEIEFTSHTSVQHTLTVGIYYEKRLTLAQRRFARAVETLARTRALLARAEARGGAEAARKAG